MLMKEEAKKEMCIWFGEVYCIDDVYTIQRELYKHFGIFPLICTIKECDGHGIESFYDVYLFEDDYNKIGFLRIGDLLELEFFERKNGSI